jgi:hypothetical protein
MLEKQNSCCVRIGSRAYVEAVTVAPGENQYMKHAGDNRAIPTIWGISDYFQAQFPEKPVGVEAYRQSGSAHVAAMAILRGDEAFKSIAFSSEWFGRGAAAGVVNPFLLKSRYVLASPEVLAFRYH